MATNPGHYSRNAQIVTERGYAALNQGYEEELVRRGRAQAIQEAADSLQRLEEERATLRAQIAAQAQATGQLRGAADSADQQDQPVAVKKEESSATVKEESPVAVKREESPDAVIKEESPAQDESQGSPLMPK